MDFSTDVTEIIKQLIPSASIARVDESKQVLYVRWDTPQGRMQRVVVLPQFVRDEADYDQTLSEITNDLKRRVKNLSSELNNVPDWDYSEPVISLN